MTAMATTRPSAFAFEIPRLRLNLFLALIGLALVSPNIPLPGALPAVRLEQMLMFVMLPSLVLFHLRNREYMRLTLLDGVFAAMAAAITISIVAAPLIVSSVEWSIRDPFEVARVAEYWLMFRFGMTLVPSEESGKTILFALFAGSIAMTAFSLIQYLDGRGSFNENVTDFWAVGHNLVGVQREGRVIGTIGNANYYSFFMALPIIGGLSLILLKWRSPSRAKWAFIVFGIFASTFSAVLSQSRTGIASILFGMFCGLVLVIAWRRPSAPFRAIAIFLACVALSVAFIQVQPPLVDSFNARFNPTKVGDDASFIIRIQRFKTFFTGFFAAKPSFCEGDPLDKREITKSHQPRAGALVSTSGADVLARDAIRKQDVGTIAGGVVAYFCDKGDWPYKRPLAELLVPKYLDAMPIDPASGQPYLGIVEGSGFFIGARLENPADPDGPNYSLGTNPNIIRNASFEGTPFGSTWGAREGASIATADGQGLFGNRAANLTLPPGGDVRQFIVFDFPLNTVHTASAWIRSTSGKDEKMRLYIIGQEAGGGEHDPVDYVIPQPDGTATKCNDAAGCRGIFTAPASGQWVPISVIFRTDAKSRFTTVQFMLRAETNETGANFLIDGAAVTQGTFAPSFLRISDVDPASLRPVDLPQFSDSPIVGVGPRNNAEAGSFDNEYVLFLDRFGLLGAGPYLAMYIAAAAVSIAAWRKRSHMMDVLGLTGFAFTMTLFLFNVGAGSYYHFAIMAIYWLFIGYLASARRVPVSEEIADTARATRPEGNAAKRKTTPGTEAPQPSAARRG